MPSTYTVNLGIEKPATGEQSGTWGDTTNINFDILDQAINGCLSLTLASAGTSGSPNTLAISDGATSDGRNKWIEFVDGGDLGATAYVQLTPNDAEKIVFIRNSLSGSRSVILFQGTYDAGRDLEVPAGVDMVVKFSGGGATATTTDVFTKLRATEITTPTLTTDDLTAGTADINDGTVEAVIGGTTPKAGTFTTLTANTNLTINSTTTVDGVIDDDTMATASATKLATSESIKAYVDSSVGAQDTLSEILANGNTSGANNLIINSGQALTANTINETTAGSGVTIDSVLLKDDSVNAATLEVTTLKANDGTAAGSIANSTGVVTLTSVDINGGNIDGTTIGATSTANGNFSTVNATDVETSTISANDGTTAINIADSTGAVDIDTSLNVDGTVQINGANTLTLRNDTATDADEPKLTFDNDTFAGATYANIRTGNGGLQLILESPSTSTFQNRHQLLFNAGAADDLQYNLSTNNGSTYVNYFKIDGGNVTFNETGADVDFRVESDTNTHMLFVDASTNRIGINEDTPTNAKLHVDAGASGDNAARFETAAAGGVEFIRTTNVGNGSTHFGLTWKNSDTDIFSITTRNRSGATASSGDIAYEFQSVATNASSYYGWFIGGAEYLSLSSTGTEFNSDSGTNKFYITRNGATNQSGSMYADDNTFVFDSTQDEVSGANFLFRGTNATLTNFNYLDLSYSSGATFNDGGLSNFDFRVEGDSNTHTLFVDASTDQVKIGAEASTWTTANLVVNGPMMDISSTTAYTTNATIVLRPSLSVDTYGWHGILLSNSTVDGYGYTIGNRRTQTDGQNPALDIRYHSNSVTGFSRQIFSSTGVVFNDDSTNFDFRVESDSQTAMLFVNAGQDCVVIGDIIGGTALFSVPKLHIDAQDSTNGIVIERARENYTCYGAAMNDNTGTCYYAYMVNGSNSKVGSIDMTSTGVSYVTTSDYRVKENVVPLTGATERLKQLNPSRFNFIVDPEKTVDGFLAHEAQTVVPEAVTGTKDEVDADGNPVYQGIDQSKLVPLLVATIKELEARITALENA